MCIAHNRYTFCARLEYVIISAMMNVSDCAILVWLSIIITLIIVPKIDAANINSRELNNNNNNEKHLVNITRHHEGDIIFIKGNIFSSNRK